MERSVCCANSSTHYSAVKLTQLDIQGAFQVELEYHQDGRGFFSRSWCHDEFKNFGLNPNLAQCNISFNERSGTLRGMHFHRSLKAEAKLVRCTRGRLFDVMVDLRQTSPTFRAYSISELSQDNHLAVYVPEGCAHGFLTLEDHTEVFYQMSDPYDGQMSAGFIWNDPDIDIPWPGREKGTFLISNRDALLPTFREVISFQP